MQDTFLVGFIKTSLIDFPGTIASAVFFPGCNMRCPYCQNRDLIIKTEHSKEDLVPLSVVYEHLEKRKNVIKGLVISGGEALLNERASTLIAFAKKCGYKIKIDTNGTLPEQLKTVIENPDTTPNIIAVDIKTSPDRYGELNPHLSAEQSKTLADNLCATATYLQKSTIPVEYRTVLVPGLVTATDIPAMATLIPPEANWKFATFRPGNCLDRLMNNAVPYSPQETENIIAVAQRFVKNASLR